MNNKEFLNWIIDRFVHVYNESPNVDFIHRLQNIANKLELMNKDHNTTIPLVGGPLCGESLTMKDGRIPNNVPVFNKGKFYVYNLCLEQSEDWTAIYYEYANEILGVNSR